MKYLSSLCLVLLMLPCPLATTGHIYYVAPGGSDSNLGTQSAPWASIQDAVYHLKPGDTLYIRGGTYTETVWIGVSGTSTAPIRIAGYPGETPVIDGQYRTLATEWSPLVEVEGSYVRVSNLEIKNSYGMGMVMRGVRDRASFIHSHHNMEDGIIVTGRYDIVEDSVVNDNCQSNVNGEMTRSSWAAGLSATRYPDHAVLRRNTVYNNWGEGLSVAGSTYSNVLSNVVYNNYATNIYISYATHAVVQRNLIYQSSDSIVTSGARAGIMMGDESKHPASAYNRIINNVVYGTNINFYWWRNDAFPVDGMVNDLVANNTFVNSTGTAGVVIARSPDHVNTRFVNNIIVQDGSLPSGLIASNIITGHNLWSKAPSSGSGPGDRIGDARLAMSLDVAAGALSPRSFKPAPDSPAINHAIVLAKVPKDFFGRTRGLKPDIGAIEYRATAGTIPAQDADPLVADGNTGIFLMGDAIVLKWLP